MSHCALFFARFQSKKDVMHFMALYGEGLDINATGYTAFKIGMRDAFFVPDQSDLLSIMQVLRTDPYFALQPGQASQYASFTDEALRPIAVRCCSFRLYIKRAC